MGDAIPLGSLVEIACPECWEDGVRLYVVHSETTRDGPLYVLAIRPDEPVFQEEATPLGHRLYSWKVFPGYSGDGLIVIRGPQQPDGE